MNSSAELGTWSVRAVNLPEHANNPIHTDVGARAAGYPSAIVAGTTVYAYLTHPAVEAWGVDWLTGGGGELRLKRAVLDDDLVHCGPEGKPAENPTDEAMTIAASVDGEVKATLDVWEHAEAAPLRDGEPLADVVVAITDEVARYGVRSGDTLPFYASNTLVHPAIWPTLANRVFVEELVTGPWVHTRSHIVHQGPVRIGDELRLESRIIDRFETRAGKRAVVDIAGTVDGRPVARIEHEALIELNEG
ncbi:MAG: hypothetical protein AAF467_00565 [Actinomycetota bacterium]